jgi:hypothetical protein
MVTALPIPAPTGMVQRLSLCDARLAWYYVLNLEAAAAALWQRPYALTVSATTTG